MKKIVIVLLLLQTAMYAQKKNVLKGTPASLKMQNDSANSEDLSRIKNDEKLKSMIKHGYLVPITTAVDIDTRLNKKFQYCRKWTNDFLIDLTNDFAKKFGTDRRIQLNSAVRTIEHQNQLQKSNCNAAKCKGDKASSHLTGATVDLAKLGLTKEELSWMRKYLSELEKKHLVEVTEETQQAVFHIMVFKYYKSRKSL